MLPEKKVVLVTIPHFTPSLLLEGNLHIQAEDKTVPPSGSEADESSLLP